MPASSSPPPLLLLPPSSASSSSCRLKRLAASVCVLSTVCDIFHPLFPTPRWHDAPCRLRRCRRLYAKNILMRAACRLSDVCRVHTNRQRRSAEPPQIGANAVRPHPSPTIRTVHIDVRSDATVYHQQSATPAPQRCPAVRAAEGLAAFF